MALHKRGDIWHYDFTIKGDRYRGTTGFKKKADAVEWVERERRAIKLGAGAPKAVHTLREAADKWFASRIAGKKSARTYAQRLKILFRHIDRELLVTQVGAREVEDAILSRRVEPIRQSPKVGEPRFPMNATVNRDLIDSTLRPILSYAEESLEEEVKRIKWTKLRLKEPKGRVRDFTADEITMWREALPEWHRPTFDFIRRYGVRLAEAFFPPEAVHAEVNEIRLTDTKNGRDHTLTILEEDMPALAARASRAGAAGLETIWYRDEAGELGASHWRAFQSASRAALDKCEIMNARPVHDLRHHAATTLHRETGSLKLVQDLLNHQTIVSSARYAHTNKADLREALRHTYATKTTANDESDVESKASRVT